jgi:hypothetical protein
MLLMRRQLRWEMVVNKDTVQSPEEIQKIIDVLSQGQQFFNVFGHWLV